MLKSEELALTVNGIDLLLEELQQPFTLQLLNLKKMKTSNRFSCELSDGLYKIKGYITDTRIN